MIRANSAFTLTTHHSHPAKALPEALLACTAKGLSPTGSLKYGGIPYGGYCSPSMAEEPHGGGGGLGICGLTTLRLSSSKYENGPADGVVMDLKGGSQTNGLRRRGSGKRGSGGGSSGKEPTDRRWCLFLVTFFIALTVVVVSFILEVLLGEHFVDKSSEDFRLKTIRQLLRETPLIGE